MKHPLRLSIMQSSFSFRLVFLFLTGIAACPIFPIVNAQTNRSVGIQLDTLLFFSSDNNVPEKAQRDYRTAFSPGTQFVNIELDVTNLDYQTDTQQYHLIFLWKYLDGSEFGRMEADFIIHPEWQTAWISRGWGFPGPENWPEGLFTAEVLLDGEPFAEQDFYISHEEYPFRVLADTSLAFVYPGESDLVSHMEIYRQLIIPDDINTYFPIEISRNGKDIAFNLDHFGVYESKGYTMTTTTTTRHVQFYRNNKMLLPVYFNIRAQFDPDMKHLFYSKLIPSKNAANYHLNRWYGYIDGAEVYCSLIDGRIYPYPSGNRFAYIMGYNNSTLQKGMGLQILANYEYLVVDQQKKQPPCLETAKRVNINHPLVFVNEDNVEKVYYTAVFKESRKEEYAFFCEDRMVSQRFNGAISQPFVSKDRLHVACIAQHDGSFFVVLDGDIVSQAYEQIDMEEVFVGLSGKVCFLALQDGKWYVVRGEEVVSAGFDAIGALTCDKSGENIAYKALDEESWKVYLNQDAVSPAYDEIGDELCFCPDGKTVAYTAVNGNTMCVMQNERRITPDLPLIRTLDFFSKEGGPALGNIIFNSSGTKIACRVITEYHDRIENSPYEKNEISYLMVNGERVTPDLANLTVISPEPGQLVFAGIDEEQKVIHHVALDF